MFFIFFYFTYSLLFAPKAPRLIKGAHREFNVCISAIYDGTFVNNFG